MAFLVEIAIERVSQAACGVLLDLGAGAEIIADEATQAIGIVCSVRDDVANAMQPLDEAACLRTVAPLAGRDRYAQWQAERIDGGMDPSLRSIVRPPLERSIPAASSHPFERWRPRASCRWRRRRGRTRSPGPRSGLQTVAPTRLKAPSGESASGPCASCPVPAQGHARHTHCAPSIGSHRRTIGCPRPCAPVAHLTRHQGLDDRPLRVAQRPSAYDRLQKQL